MKDDRNFVMDIYSFVKKVVAQRDELLAACQYGGPRCIEGPELLRDCVHALYEAGYPELAQALESKEEIERAAIDAVGGT